MSHRLAIDDTETTVCYEHEMRMRSTLTPSVQHDYDTVVDTCGVRGRYTMEKMTWDDCRRSECQVGGGEQRMTDVQAVTRNCKPVYMIRRAEYTTDNVTVSSSDIGIAVGNLIPQADLHTIPLSRYLRYFGTDYGRYVNHPGTVNSLHSESADSAVRMRFQAVLLPQDSEFGMYVQSGRQMDSMFLLCEPTGTSVKLPTDRVMTHHTWSYADQCGNCPRRIWLNSSTRRSSENADSVKSGEDATESSAKSPQSVSTMTAADDRPLSVGVESMKDVSNVTVVVQIPLDDNIPDLDDLPWGMNATQDDTTDSFYSYRALRDASSTLEWTYMFGYQPTATPVTRHPSTPMTATVTFYFSYPESRGPGRVEIRAAVESVERHYRMNGKLDTDETDD